MASTGNRKGKRVRNVAIRVVPRVDVIQAELVRRGWNQTILAEKMRTPISYVSEVLNLVSPPGQKFRTQLIKAFGGDPEADVEKWFEIRAETAVAR